MATRPQRALLLVLILSAPSHSMASPHAPFDPWSAGSFLTSCRVLASTNGDYGAPRGSERCDGGIAVFQQLGDVPGRRCGVKDQYQIARAFVDYADQHPNELMYAFADIIKKALTEVQCE